MNRSVRALALASTLSCVWSAPPALAVSSISMIWESTGTPTITVSSTVDQLLRANLVVSADSAGIGGIFLSFLFDEDFGNELDIAPAAIIPTRGDGGSEQQVNIPGMGNALSPGLPGFQREQIESGFGVVGILSSYDVTARRSGLVSGTRTLGSIFFETNAFLVPRQSDFGDPRVDVRPAILCCGFDGVLDASGRNISDEVLLSGARVWTFQQIPEPASTLLLLTGLGSCGWIGAREARSRKSSPERRGSADRS